jgi:Asp-tRNA(Asn)/Glu-tRNA(Gln) amidotransferase A subunit family amidase
MPFNMRFTCSSVYLLTAPGDDERLLKAAAWAESVIGWRGTPPL